MKLTDYTLDYYGELREYTLALPSVPTSTYVVLLHPYGGDPHQTIAQGGELCERYGFALIAPHGVERSWNAGACCGAAKAMGSKDDFFVTMVVRKVVWGESKGRDGGGKSGGDGGRVLRGVNGDVKDFGRGRMNGRKDARMDGRVDKRMDARVDGRMGGRVDGEMDAVEDGGYIVGRDAAAKGRPADVEELVDGWDGESENEQDGEFEDELKQLDYNHDDVVEKSSPLPRKAKHSRHLAKPAKSKYPDVYLVGYSNGAFLTSKIALLSARGDPRFDWVSGIATFAGYQYDSSLYETALAAQPLSVGAQVDVENLDPNRFIGRRRFPVLLIHGLADEAVRPEGCCSTSLCCCEITHDTCVPVDYPVRMWQEINQCQDKPIDPRWRVHNQSCMEFPSCELGGPVVYCPLVGAGHRVVGYPKIFQTVGEFFKRDLKKRFGKIDENRVSVALDSDEGENTEQGPQEVQARQQIPFGEGNEGNGAGTRQHPLAVSQNVFVILFALVVCISVAMWARRRRWVGGGYSAVSQQQQVVVQKRIDDPAVG